MEHKTPIIMIDPNSARAFSVFNPNDWIGDSKLIIQSCAINYGLVIYTTAKIKNIFTRADDVCVSRFNDLQAQWKMSRWPLSSCAYLVDIPEAHLSMHSFYSSVKTLLDVLVQLISTEKIVHTHIHGFHKKGVDVGGQLLDILTNNASKPKKELAAKLHDLISQHKNHWIDHAVNNRDFFIHPEKGLNKVTFALTLREVNNELKLETILKPSIDGDIFDIYSEKILKRIEEFSRAYVDLLKYR